jgi:CelD/BcsL family acetyltransferase involved in cellulose biosynthesis
MGQGRLFRMDFTEAARKSAPPGRGLADQEMVAPIRGKSRPVEHFWLCENCARTMTVALSNAGEVEVVPLETVPPRMSAVSSRKTQRGREEAAS